MATITFREWRILDYGPDFKATSSIPYCCPNCGVESRLPIGGRATAQLGNGALIFGRGPKRVPKSIQCRHCRMRFESGSPAPQDTSSQELAS